MAKLKIVTEKKVLQITQACTTASVFDVVDVLETLQDMGGYVVFAKGKEKNPDAKPDDDTAPSPATTPVDSGNILQ